MKFTRRRETGVPAADRVLTKVRGWRRKSITPTLNLDTFGGMGPVEQGIVVAVTGASLLAVFGVGMAISYSHMHDWAIANHEPPWRAELFPLSVDGSMIVASMIVYADTRADRPRDWMAYGMVGLGAGWSVMANMAHSWIDPVAAKMIAGWPAFALFTIVELGRRFVQRVRRQANERRRAQARAARRATPTPPQPTEVAGELVPMSRPPALEAAAEVDGAERPSWLREGMSARDAMFAYLDEKPLTTGAELDRVVGIPHFRTGVDYGRKIRAAWLKERGRS